MDSFFKYFRLLFVVIAVNFIFLLSQASPSPQINSNESDYSSLLTIERICPYLRPVPLITSLIPKNKSKVTAGDIVDIRVRVRNPGCNLKYRYLVNKKVIRNWTSSPGYSWRTAKNDFGSKRIRVEARNIYGRGTFAETNVFIIRNPPQPNDKR
ncbi:MAG: hypothetical protein PHY56_05120 [Candidatus Omnitrophica bacterium]|nr:hypothetical protein [Candidatus Omnitrophota bacterium]